jgi:uncharacterized protein (TIGR02611 family)
VKQAAKKVAVVTAGWILLVVGIIALPLPGPGLLICFGAVAILATQYEWAERRLDPVRKRALRGAADSVKTWPRICLSGFGVGWLVGLGIVWGMHPPAPSWWPIDDKWWLFGGWGTGSTLIFSGIVAGALLVYSYRNFREIQEEKEAAAHAAVD